jgi:adenylyltransferase/sulfurtransferase
MLTEQQIERYARHLLLPEIGEQGQLKLLNSRVLVVGAGGLGAPVLQYLTAAGVGTIGIVDADTVGRSNLQRQVLFREDEIGHSKAQQSAITLQRLNSDVSIKSYPYFLTVENAREIMMNYDIVVGATDNFVSRQLIDETSRALKIPFVHGSIGEFEGQVSVFNYQNGPSYSDLYTEFPEPSTLPLGVLGVLPGVIGSIQATEVIKIVVGIGDVLSGKLLFYNALKMQFYTLAF